MYVMDHQAELLLSLSSPVSRQQYKSNQCGQDFMLQTIKEIPEGKVRRMFQLL